MSTSMPKDTIFRILSKSSQSGHDVTDDSRLFEDLQLDSLDGFEILVTVEDEFGIDIPDEDCSGLRTVSQVVALVEAKLAQRSGGNQ